MAVTDAYATASLYRSLIDKVDDAEDAEIDDDLLAVSRHLDRCLGQFFTKDAAVVARLFNGNGGRRLYVDTKPQLPGIADLTGLIVKADLNADYDVVDSGETLTINTDFWVGPWDAASGPEPQPYRFLEINPNSTVLSGWPNQIRSVEVTAIWCWPAVPKAIERATIHLTAILRLESERATRRVQEGLDTAIETSREAQTILKSLKGDYAALVKV